MARLDDYSAAYYLMDGVDVLPYSGEKVAIDDELMAYLTHHVRKPILKLDGGHHVAHNEWGVPADTVAVPREIDVSDRDHVLLAKDDTALDLVMGNQLDSK